MIKYQNVRTLMAVMLIVVAGVWLLIIADLWQAIFVFVNLGAFLCYGLDKYRAIHNSGRRIPENVLLGVAAIDGIPGSILGQVIFHHKVRKQPFRRIFWIITSIHLVVGTLWIIYK